MTAPKHQRVFTQTFGVTGAILEKNGKILLVKENARKYPDHGKWNQPAGWIEVGENPLEAVKKEVREETGYDFIPKAILGVYSLVRNDITDFCGGHSPHGVKIVYTGSFLPTEVAFDATEISEIRWFTPEEIYAMDSQMLRDVDIKKEVHDYFLGKRYPLSLVTHTASIE